MSSSRDENDDRGGPPLPDFSGASAIQLSTIAPALGHRQAQTASPDYLDYDPKGRGIIVTMFANAGMSYLMGVSVGGVYGTRLGLQATPSSRFRVQLNSVLNHAGRYGSKAGNTLGAFACLYSVYEGLADRFELEDNLGISSISPTLGSMTSPAFGATLTGLTYYGLSGPRVAALAGALGFGSVAVTYAAYTALGIPYGSRGYLFL